MRTEGFEVLVHEVMEAMTTLPCLSESFTDAGTCSWTFGSSTPTAAGLPPSCSQCSLVVVLLLVVVEAAAAAADLGLISEGSA